MVNNADVSLERWRGRRFVRFLGGRSRTSSPTIVVVVVVDIVYEEQAGAHGDGQKHGCSMALGGHEIKQFPISKMFFKRFFF